jgi:hypothetical protein
MPDDLYTADILRWSGQQADLLRRLACGERVNDAIDWENVAEEVESVGWSELHAVESLLSLAISHLLKAHCWPDGPTQHWQHEAVTFLRGARRRFAPSMRQNLDLGALYDAEAEDVLAYVIAGRVPAPLPAKVPWSLDDLIVPSPARPDIDALLAALRPRPPEPG